MQHRILLACLLLPFLSLCQARDMADSSGKKPDLGKIDYRDIYWTKAEGASFWFYYKPTHYFFAAGDFETIPLESGEIMVYLFESGMYLLLPDYFNVPPNKEKPVEFAADRSCVFVRSSKGGFRIYDHGKYVYNLESIGVNTLHQHVYRSRLTDKRYWIEEYDFSFARVAKPVGILSE